MAELDMALLREMAAELGYWPATTRPKASSATGSSTTPRMPPSTKEQLARGMHHLPVGRVRENAMVWRVRLVGEPTAASSLNEPRVHTSQRTDTGSASGLALSRRMRISTRRRTGPPAMGTHQ